MENIIADGEHWTCLDYEWVFDFPVPVGFVVFRAIYHYYFHHSADAVLPMNDLCAALDISQDRIGTYLQMEAEFQVVKKYVQDNPGSDIRMVSEACEVDPMQIRQWVKEERLCFSDDSPVGIPCERCGATIKSGRFCATCKADIKSDLKSVMPKATVAQPTRSSTDHRMRFLEQ